MSCSSQLEINMRFRIKMEKRNSLFPSNGAVDVVVIIPCPITHNFNRDSKQDDFIRFTGQMHIRLKFIFPQLQLRLRLRLRLLLRLDLCSLMLKLYFLFPFRFVLSFVFVLLLYVCIFISLIFFLHFDMCASECESVRCVQW